MEEFRVVSNASLDIRSVCLMYIFVFFVKQKTAYEMRISDWSSDVCSSDLRTAEAAEGAALMDFTLTDDQSALVDAIDRLAQSFNEKPIDFHGYALSGDRKSVV